MSILRSIVLKTLLFGLLIFPALTLAQVERSQLTSDVSQREPTDDLGSKVSLQGQETQLVFFTEVHNLQGRQIVHRWLFEGQEMASVALDIGGPRWRTYSRKRILPSWQGNWEIQVWQGDLQLISYTFEVE